MSFQSLHALLPVVAENETGSITISQNAPGLPPSGRYMLLELFCTEQDCDCRNVMISVFHVEKKQHVVRLCYCWGAKSYYDGIGLDFMAEVPGVFVDMGSANPFGKYFEDAFKSMCYLNPDSKIETEYAQRLKKHYRQFREQLRKNPGRFN